MVVLARLLPSQSLAVWFVFTSILGLATLAEGGLARIVTREVAHQSGVCEPAADPPSETTTFVAATAAIYIALITVVCVLGGIAGVAWFKWGMHLGPESHLFLAWAIFVLGSTVALLSGFLGAVVCGLQDVAAVQKSSSAGAVVNTAVVLSMLLLTGTLLAPAAALLGASATSLWLNKRRLRKLIPDFRVASVIRIGPSHLRVARDLLPDMGRMLLMMSAYQGLTSGFIVLLSAYSPIELVASYGLTMQLVAIVIVFADTWMTAVYPRLAAARGRGSVVLRRLAVSAIARGATFAALGLVALWILGPWLMQLIGSQTKLLGGTALVVVLLVIGTEYFFGVTAQVPISQGHLGVAYFSFAGALMVLAAALALLSAGVSIGDAFVARLIIYTAVCGIPSAALCARFLIPRRTTAQ